MVAEHLFYTELIHCTSSLTTMSLELRTLSTEMYFMLVMMLNEPVFEIDRNSLEGVGAEVWRKLVCGSTNWAWVPGNVQFRSYSGAASMLRQSGNILDIATAMCSRSNCAVASIAFTRS